MESSSLHFQITVFIHCVTSELIFYSRFTREILFEDSSEMCWRPSRPTQAYTWLIEEHDVETCHWHTLRLCHAMNVRILLPLILFLVSTTVLLVLPPPLYFRRTDTQTYSRELE